MSGQKIAVIGARRQRQGTGYYIALAFARQGCDIQAIVGTEESRVSEALTMLDAQGIKARGYLDSRELFANEDIDIVVIATPPQHHLQYIEESLSHRCHVFCEKPLFLPSDNTAPEVTAAQTRDLSERFQKAGCYIHLNTQWPHTLAAFRSLYPDIALEPSTIQSFAMELCPQSDGIDMLIDAAPHFLSMLYALLGSGELDACRVMLMPERASIQCVYRHPYGTTEAGLVLQQYLEQPKPAAYAINGYRIERHVDMKDYSLSFSHPQQSIACVDPLESSVRQCLGNIRSGTSMPQELLDGMKHLHQLITITHGQNSL